LDPLRSSHSPRPTPPTRPHGDTPRLGFLPITSNALPCSTNGLIQFANDSANQPLTTDEAHAGRRSATPVNAPASSNKVGRVNDMIALSPDGRYLFTPSENSIPTENGIGVQGATLHSARVKGPNQGKRRSLPTTSMPRVRTRGNESTVLKWYPRGGPEGEGILLASEEFTGGRHLASQSEDRAFVRLDWLGNYATKVLSRPPPQSLPRRRGSRCAIYKGSSERHRDLTKGGTLYYLVAPALTPSGWKQVVNPRTHRWRPQQAGAILFDRPEDFDEHNGASTSRSPSPPATPNPRVGAAGQVVNRGGVYSLSTVAWPTCRFRVEICPTTGCRR